MVGWFLVRRYKGGEGFSDSNFFLLRDLRTGSRRKVSGTRGEGHMLYYEVDAHNTPLHPGKGGREREGAGRGVMITRERRVRALGSSARTVYAHIYIYILIYVYPCLLGGKRAGRAGGRWDGGGRRGWTKGPGRKRGMVGAIPTLPTYLPTHLPTCRAYLYLSLLQTMHNINSKVTIWSIY